MTLRTFELTGDLPSGTTVLEASAGTGKTYTIAGLVARWIAETDRRLPDLLVVTFTRAATAELRDRVRRRLVAAGDHLAAALAGAPRQHHDPVLAHLADAEDAALRERRAKLSRAITDVDVATISTIHGFCQHVLDGLGIASELDRDAELVEDLGELIEEVTDDLLVDTYLDGGDRPRISRSELLSLGRVAVANPTTALAPRGHDGGEAGLRLHLAQRFRHEVAARARRRRRLSYDDLLTQLDATLRDPERGGAARDALRRRYRVVLIDEFQDTDPLQWRIVSDAFGEPGEGRALVLIGDPKQAIYSFRGADVYAYLQAAEAAADRRTLGTNWRSDARLLNAFDVLCRGATFGDTGIPYRRVAHAPGHDAPRIDGTGFTTPLRLRHVPTYPGLLTSRGKVSASDARSLIARDLAADVVRLLGDNPTLVDRNQDGAELDRRPLKPRDIAVLVRSNDQASLVQAALADVSVPSVVGGVDSVFATSAATDWRRLLEALDRPASNRGVRALALTPWIGWTGDDVAGASETEWDRLHEDVHAWAETLRDDGVAAMHRRVVLERGLRARLLTRQGGERALADLDHIAELLHAAAAAEHLGVAGLLGWLQERVEDRDQQPPEDRLRRLETDDEAVQILTIHRSKGLEFPVVYCPYLWSSNVSAGAVPVFHDDQGVRTIDVGGRGAHGDFDEHAERAEIESRGEELRLVYVAMTRARHQVVAWYAPAGNLGWSGLARLLLCRDDDGSVESEREAPRLDDDALVAELGQLAETSRGDIAIETVPEDPALTPWNSEISTAVELERARFDRGLDDHWRRTSYSALTRLGGEPPVVGSEPIAVGKDDEADDLEVVVDAAASSPDPHGLGQLLVPLADLPGGTHVGTLVHRLLELSDFAAEDLEGELTSRAGPLLTESRLPIDLRSLVGGLATALRTPLGAAAGEHALSDLTRADRRDEVEFELPLDHAPGGHAATVADVAALLREHLPPDDPLAAYADHLPTPLLTRDLRGFLGGSIDLVLRRSDADGDPIFHVADYKTNRLGMWGEPLTAWDYRPAALVEAMMHGHYPIQAVLYAVALHRMLRWRLPDYDPERHLGDVLYLFVRGMVGPDVSPPGGQPCGVFAWHLPSSLVGALSDRLHGFRR